MKVSLLFGLDFEDHVNVADRTFAEVKAESCKEDTEVFSMPFVVDRDNGFTALLESQQALLDHPADGEAKPALIETVKRWQAAYVRCAELHG